MSRVDGRRPPFTGLHANAPKWRWTGEDPDPAYLNRLRQAVANSPNPDKDVRLWQLVYGDVTGFAFTRAALEWYYDLPGVSRTRKRRIALLLDALPPWPFEPTPTGWSASGFPKEIF